MSVALSAGQVKQFETFGFVRLEGAVRHRIEGVVEAFEDVMAVHGAGHDGSKRTAVVPFIDQDERLCTLLDEPAIEEAAASLLGPDFNYLGGDGNYYVGDTGWHSDGFHSVGRFIKVALYLDPVTRDTGALRVIPGSHRPDSHWRAEGPRVMQSETEMDIPASAVPAVPLDSTPGDVMIFNHNILHASFGGNSRRRMFTLNLSRRAATAEELEDLRAYIGVHDRFLIDSLVGEKNLASATPSRRVHFEQVLANQEHLAPASARLREESAVPANG
jgi:hypothetical protein